MRRTHAGIRRAIGAAQQGKAPAVVTDLKRVLGKMPNTRVGLRDRALLFADSTVSFMPQPYSNRPRPNKWFALPRLARHGTDLQCSVQRRLK